MRMKCKNKVLQFTAMNKENSIKYYKHNIFLKYRICQEENSYGGRHE